MRVSAARDGIDLFRIFDSLNYVPAMLPGTEDEWRALAAAHFSGEIILGNDLTTITAP